jgi:hypothetical protein
MANMDNWIIGQNLEKLHESPKDLFQIILKVPHDQMFVRCLGMCQWSILEISAREEGKKEA